MVIEKDVKISTMEMLEMVLSTLKLMLTQMMLDEEIMQQE